MSDPNDAARAAILDFHRDPAAWLASHVACRECKRRHVCAMPASSPLIDPDTLGFRDTECPHCGAMACDTIDLDEAG